MVLVGKAGCHLTSNDDASSTVRLLKAVRLLTRLVQVAK